MLKTRGHPGPPHPRHWCRAHLIGISSSLSLVCVLVLGCRLPARSSWDYSPRSLLFGGSRYFHSVTAHTACGIAASDRTGVVLAGVLRFPLAGNRIGRIMLTLNRVAARRAEHSRHLPRSRHAGMVTVLVADGSPPGRPQQHVARRLAPGPRNPTAVSSRP